MTESNPPAGPGGSSELDRWRPLTGSVTGREHVRLGRNNQDAWAVRRGPNAWAAVVADGCSAGRHSEVGAWLAARRLSAWLATDEAVGWSTYPETLAALASQLILGQLQALAALDAAEGAELARETVQDLCLFTLLAVQMTPTDTTVMGLGDGLFAIDGRVVVLDAGPQNAPSYLGYGLLSATQAAAAGGLRPLYRADTRGLTSVVVATDGATELCREAQTPLRDGSLMGGLATLATDGRFLRNPSLLQKRLNVIGPIHGRLFDDTTIVVLRREEG